MISIPSIVYAIKTVVATSIFFVWVVRYREILEEFKTYQLPSWLRDLVGILKLSFAIMLFSNDTYVIILGALGICFLMFAAVLTHIRVKNPFYKMLPAFGLIILNLIIIIFTYKWAFLWNIYSNIVLRLSIQLDKGACSGKFISAGISGAGLIVIK